LTRSGDGFQERRIGSRSGRVIACDDQTHLDTTPPDCHGKEARNDQLVGVRRGPRQRLGYRHLERYADAGIAQVCAIDQGIQGCSGFDLRLQALSPRCCRREERWKSIVRETDRLGSRGDSGPVAQDLASRRRDGSLDLWCGQSPAAPCRIRRPLDQAARHVITISSLALYRVTWRQALAAFTS
jgi:hypothetical protein